MAGSDPSRIRREPPRFRRATVVRAEPMSPRLQRITLGGPELDGFRCDEPAASVRVLLPSPGADALVIPEWTGNEFLLPGGSRPPIRTFTPLRADPDAGELDVCVVTHGTGRASSWASRAERGEEVAISGPGRGYDVDRDARSFLVGGDETAIPAMLQLLERLPDDAAVIVHVEVADANARLPFPDHPNLTVEWHELPRGAPPGDALVATVGAAELPPDARVWVAGEAAAVQRIRKDLFEARTFPRARAVVRGYWKHGRPGT